MNTDLTTPHPLQRCWDLQLAGLVADALHTALSQRLFDHLPSFHTAQQVADALGLNAIHTGYLLELLWAQGLLERDQQAPERYRNTEHSQHYLNRQSPQYCGDALQFRHGALRQAGSVLTTALTEGLPPPPPTNDQLARRWAEAARVQIAQEQRAVSVETACTLLEALPEFPGLRQMLDLGGGPGLVAIALAQRLPALRGNVFELPHTAEVAQANITQTGLGERLQGIAGNLDSDDIGRDYDLIWCSSVLHFSSDPDALLQRLHEALKPGGVLVCCHAEVPTDPHTAVRVLPYYLHMRMQGRHVLPAADLAGRLLALGFVGVEQHDNLRYPVAPVTAVIARRA